MASSHARQPAPPPQPEPVRPMPSAAPVSSAPVSKYLILHTGEQGWRSGESTRLPPMWPGFESWTRCHVG